MDHSSSSIGADQAAEIIPGDAQRRAEQMSLNFNWLLARMDEAHDHLCPGRIGTWQQRAEQVAEAAKAIRAKEIAPHNLLVVEPSAKSRILGGIYGSIVGDALGVPREFKSRESCKLNPVFGMEGFGSHGKPPGTWSDDSSLMLCTVDSIIDTGKIDADDLGKKFLAWRKHGLWTTDGHVFDIGIATSSALARIASGVPAIEAGGKGENSNGNGSLMRILPVSIWNAYHDDDAENCRIASSVTHGHRRSIMACHFHSILVESLMAGHSIEHAYTISVNGFRALYSEDPEFRHFAHLDEMLAHRPEEQINSGGYVLDTLFASVWCLLTTKSFSECVLKAVNLGGDTDTSCCVAGGLAGIYYGLGCIPNEWISALPRRDDLDALFEGFIP